MRRRIGQIAIVSLIVPSIVFLVALFLVLAGTAADNEWPAMVPDADRDRANPYSGKADAIAAGSRLFADHCAKCHGSDALGRGKRPSLRTPDVQGATDGEIFWLLTNGNRRRGMPSWSTIPEPSRWQLVSYVKSLGISDP